MKTKYILHTKLIFFAALLFIGSQAFGQTTYTYQSGKMTINGTSSLHDWESNVGTILFKGSVHVQNQVLQSIEGVKVTIPVESIKSSKGRIMDGKTHDALKKETFPNIECTISKVNITPADGKFKVKATGQLTIAGKTKPVELMLTANLDNHGLLTFTGSKAFKMTDYGIDPPKALLGTLKTGDDISINFTVNMKADTTTADK
ncbi:MAG: YceI family protein [Saprospiraceae bacterium]